ncbi:stage II sporulation protein P [Clostridium cellulovorans]|uniref:Stage II sporulation protein P n=1 Tax=Clostridium cellulovorans (strain ATCC 35296 / DSM 3052 / OCM 3 / 743B) TaxID=573061 RepID=D9SW20_CLOC7|nr:stage II sporulation protein P [Clostridium cellulovorans]ADL51164.1 stage II sporulation protein P [Clostridium cellulovorans 743B]
MSYKVRNKEKGLEALTITLFLFLIFTIILSALLKYWTVWGDINKTGQNTFYKKLIDNSVTYIGTNAEMNADNSESAFTLKKVFSKIFNMSLDAPQTIIVKETPILFKKTPSVEDKKSRSLYNIIKSFTLNDGDIVIEQPSNVVPPLNPDEDYNNLHNFDKNLIVKPSSKPQVLIYHTHTYEAYNDTGSSTQKNPNLSVVAVGEVLTKELNRYGYNVIHDTSDHSFDYNNAYASSRESFKNYLNTYGDFQLVIDLHRDAGSIKASFTCSINNNLYSKAMFVYDTSFGSYNKNIEVMNNLMAIGNSIYPGLIKSPTEYNGGILCFNQDLSNNAVLIEVGADCNTLGESKNTASALSRIIAQYLYNKNPH